MVFKLNATGITFVSETQTVADSNHSGLNSIEVSPNGDKILLVLDASTNSVSNNRGTYLYDFNKFTGNVVANSLINLNSFSYGASFSPNNNLLYLNGDKSYQINLQDLNFNASKKLFYNTNSFSYGDIQRGPDNKLYYTYPYENPKSLYVIHNPNGLITANEPNACQFSKNGPSVNITVAHSSIGLPNMINSKKETAFETNAISSYPISCNTRKFFPDSYGISFNWNFGDPASGANNTYSGTLVSHTFSNSGTFIVTLRSDTNVFIAQTTIVIGITPKVILGNSSACILGTSSNITNNSVVLNNGETAVWSITPGSGAISGVNNQSNVTVNWTTLPGIITLTVTNLSGCVLTTTKTISAINVISPTFNPIASICSGATSPVLPTTSTNSIGISGTWSPVVNNTVTTTYTFTPTAGQCATTATLTITVLPSSDPLCGNTNSNCSLSTLTLSVPEPNATVIYRRQNSISTITNYLVTTGKNVTMRAGDFISIKPNTYINSGAVFSAKIEPCITNKTVKVGFNIGEQEGSKNIVLFPNPNNGSFELINIDPSLFDNKPIQLNVYDLNGRNLFSKNLSDSEIPNCQVDLQQFTDGMYLVKLNSETYSQDFKLIKK